MTNRQDKIAKWQKYENGKFLYYFFRLMILWIMAGLFIIMDNKNEIENYLTTFISEKVQTHEQTIEHETGRSAQHHN